MHMNTIPIGVAGYLHSARTLHCNTSRYYVRATLRHRQCYQAGWSGFNPWCHALMFHGPLGSIPIFIHSTWYNAAHKGHKEDVTCCNLMRSKCQWRNLEVHYTAHWPSLYSNCAKLRQIYRPSITKMSPTIYPKFGKKKKRNNQGPVINPLISMLAGCWPLSVCFVCGSCICRKDECHTCASKGDLPLQGMWGKTWEHDQHSALVTQVTQMDTMMASGHQDKECEWWPFSAGVHSVLVLLLAATAYSVFWWANCTVLLTFCIT